MLQEEKVVPPARPLLYCQIPFFQTNLTDTPVTVTMIEVSFNSFHSLEQMG